MQRNARAAIAVAAVAILTTAFLALRPKDDDTSSSTTPTTTAAAVTSSPTTAASASPEPTTTTTAKPKPPLLTAAKVTELEVSKGDTVRFRARSATDDEIHVHGYDLSKEAPAGRTVSMSFKATIEGVFEIEFENAGAEIASLRVDP